MRGYCPRCYRWPAGVIFRAEAFNLKKYKKTTVGTSRAAVLENTSFPGQTMNWRTQIETQNARNSMVYFRKLVLKAILRISVEGNMGPHLTFSE